MKKIDPNRELYRRRAGVARWLNELSRKGLSYSVRKESRVSKGAGWEVIVAPKIISIYSFGERTKHYEETLRFLDDIKRRFLRKDCFIDFSKTTSITAAALVVVYAALPEFIE